MKLSGPLVQSWVIFCLSLGLSILVPDYSFAQPVAAFTIDAGSAASGCPPHTVKFKNQSTGATTYQWQFSVPSPNTSTLKDPQWVFYSPGQYSVTLTAYNGSQSNTLTKTFYITVHDTPKVDFTATPLAGCAPLNVTYTNLTQTGGTSATYTWYFGTTGTFPNVTYMGNGLHTVTLSATNNFKCTKSKTRTGYINVKAKPTVDFLADAVTFCGSSAQVNFTSFMTGGMAPFTYLWNFGSTVANPSNVGFSSPPQSHDIKLVATDANGCKDSLTKPAYINFTKTTAGFQGPASVCVWTPTVFVNNTQPCADRAFWWFDYPSQTDTISGLSPFHSYTTPGVKTIKMVTWCGPCPDTFTRTITVHPLPSANFTIDPDSACPAPAIITFIPDSMNLKNYTWEFGSLQSPDARTSTQPSPTHTYTANGFDTVICSVTDKNGCSATKTETPAVKIYDLHVVAEPDPFEGCIPLSVRLKAKVYTTINPLTGLVDGTNGYPWGVKEYRWIFQSGPDNYGPAVNHIFTLAGEHSVILKVTTNNGCVIYDTTKIVAGIVPHDSFIGPSRICYNEIINLQNTSIPPHNNYLWIWGNINNVTRSINGIYKFKDPGTYEVGLVTYHNGCPSDTFYKTIIVDSPKAELRVKTFCHADSLKHIFVQNKSIGADVWLWDFGDGTTSTARDTFHQYAALGSYTVKLYTHNTTSGCRDTASMKIDLFAPDMSFTASDTTICKKQSVHFSSSITTIGGSTSYQYSWFINNRLLNPVYFNRSTMDSVFSDTGYHSIKLTVMDGNGCYHSLAKNQYILVSQPYPVITASPVSGCVPQTVTYTDIGKIPAGASAASRIWTLTGGAPSTANTSSASATTSYFNAGSYYAKLVVTDNVGCIDSAISYTVNVYKPEAKFNCVDTGCQNKDITFYNGSTNNYKNLWDFGDGTTSTATQPDHSYSQLGTYNVRLIVEDNHGCTDTMTEIASLAITRPYASFTMSDSIGVCPPLAITLTNTSTGPNVPAFGYGWQTGINKYVSTNVTEAYTTPGIYTVTLEVITPWGCRDSAKKTVTLYGFAGSLTYAPLLGCVPLEVTFAPIGLKNVPYITWDFTDGVVLRTSILDTVKHTYYTSGSYLPNLILEDKTGCKTTSNGIERIRVDETFADFTTGPGCEKQNMEFFDNSRGIFSSITSWLWTFSGTDTSNIKNPKRYYGIPGTYDVKLIVSSAHQCKDTIEKTITIHQLPVINAGTDTTVCLKDSAMLMPGGGLTYKWSPKAYLSCDSCINPMAGPPKKTTFTVIGTDMNGCKNKDSVTVDIKFKVVAEAGPGGEICNNDTIRLSVSGADTYEWWPAESLDSNTIPRPLATPHANTNYRVLSFEGRCIPDTDYVTVKVYPLPTVTAEGATTIVAGNTADLRAVGSLIQRFQWSPSESLNCSDCAFPTASPSQTTTYTVKVYTDFGCVDSDQITVTVVCDKSQLFMPNTFTPNGDGQNDVFYPRSNGMDRAQSFRIYNRWGETIFQRTSFNLNDPNFGWDGTYNGVQLPPDVYVWVLDALCDGGKTLILKGDVTIIR